MFNWFKKNKEIIVISNKDFTQDDAQRIEKKTGRICILVPNLNNIEFLNYKDITAEKSKYIEKHLKPIQQAIIIETEDPVDQLEEKLKQENEK